MTMDIAVLGLEVKSDSVREATNRLREFEGQSTKAETATGSLERKVVGLAVAYASFKLAGHITELATLSARYETMGVVLNVAGNNAGYTAQEMAYLEKQLQRTGISMMESRQVLSQMAAANLQLADATKLARAAQDTAVVGNINSSEAFARMVHGIKSGEVEILRTMGLQVSWEAGYNKMATQLGTTADKLNEQQKIMSRSNTVLEAAAGYVGIYEQSMKTAGKQLSSMPRYLEDFKVSLGAVFNPATAEIIGTVNSSLKDMTAYLQDDGTRSGLVATAGVLASLVRDLKDAVVLTGEIVGSPTAAVGASSGLMQTIKQAYFRYVSEYSKEDLAAFKMEDATHAQARASYAASLEAEAAASLAANRNRKAAAAAAAAELKNQASALENVREAYARLTMSKEEFDWYKQARQIEDWTKTLGGGNTELAKTAAMLERMASWDSGKPLELGSFYNYEQFQDASRLRPTDTEQEDAGAEVRSYLEQQSKRDLQVLTEFDAAYRQSVQGETAFKVAQIEEQARVWQDAGADEVRVAQWVEAEKLKVSRDWSDGATRALQDYADEASNTAAQTERAFRTAFRAAEDYMVQFVQTGKLSFSDLANSITADLIRMGTQQAITGPIAASMSGWDLGSMFAGIFHEGGVVGQTAAPTRAVDPGIFVGAPRLHSGLASDEYPAILQRGEAVIPRGGSAEKTSRTEIVIQNAPAGTKEVGRESNSSGGERIILQLGSELARQDIGMGGPLSKTLEAKYGLIPVGRR